MSITVPTMTGYSAFWSTTGDMLPYATLSRTAQGWRSKLESQVAQLFNKAQLREQRELILTLLGVAAGQTALSTYKRVAPPASTNATTPTPSSTDELGGLRTIDTVTVINRVSATADVTYLTSLFDGTMNNGPAGITFINDSGGNGSSTRTSSAGW